MPLLQHIKERYNLTKRSALVVGISLSILLVFAYLSVVMSNIASYWSISNKTTDPLPDIFFEYFPAYNLHTYVDNFLTGYITICILAVLRRKDALLIYFKTFTCTFISYGIRLTLLAATNLPDPNMNCFKVATNILTESRFGRCGDLLFSGHTISFTTVFLVWYDYPFFNSRALYKISVATIFGLYVLGLAGILLSRYHYTVDILLSIYVTFFVWRLFDYYWAKDLQFDAHFADLNINERI